MMVFAMSLDYYRYCSTSPKVEPPGFCESMRATFRWFWPCSDEYDDEACRITFVILCDQLSGEWSQIQGPCSPSLQGTWYMSSSLPSSLTSLSPSSLSVTHAHQYHRYFTKPTIDNTIDDHLGKGVFQGWNHRPVDSRRRLGQSGWSWNHDDVWHSMIFLKTMF